MGNVWIVMVIIGVAAGGLVAGALFVLRLKKKRQASQRPRIDLNKVHTGIVDSGLQVRQGDGQPITRSTLGPTSKAGGQSHFEAAMFQLRLLTLPNIRALVGQFPSWRKELEGAEEAALQVFEQSLGNAEEFKKRLQQLGSIEEELGVVLRKEFHANLRRLASIAGGNAEACGWFGRPAHSS